MTFLGGVYTGVVCGLLSLVATVLVDSFLWGYWVWPEGAVLFFNTALNKSSDWGVSPWHWYASSALPRALHFLIPFVLCAWLGLRLPSHSEKTSFGVWLSSLFHWDSGGTIYYSAPAVAYIALYSFLAHKELRFILPVLPMLLLSAACGIDRVLVSNCQERSFKGEHEDKIRSSSISYFDILAR